MKNLFKVTMITQSNLQYKSLTTQITSPGILDLRGNSVDVPEEHSLHTFPQET